MENSYKNQKITMEIAYKNLLYACEYLDINLAKRMLDIKIIPDKMCFEKLITNCSTYGTHSARHPKLLELLEMLISYGYLFTYDDLLRLIKNGVYPTNIERFNFDFDKRYLEVCISIKHIPYPQYVKGDIETLKILCNENFLLIIRQIIDNGVEPTIECLRAACLVKNNLGVIKLLCTKGVKPDFQCLENACKVSNNYVVLKYLIETHNVKPTINCIQALADFKIRNATLSYLLEQYKKN